MEAGWIKYTIEFVWTFLYYLAFSGPIIVFLILLIGLIGFAIGRIERWSLSAAIYHAFINATTVGYGDLRPTKPRSKVLAVVNAFVGLILTGIIVAIGLRAAVIAMGYLE